MRNRLNSNISFNGKLNVFSFNPKTKMLENTLVDTSRIRAVKVAVEDGQQVNILRYSTPNGVKECSSINLFPDFTVDKLKMYIHKQTKQANSSGNVVDVLL